MAPALAKPNDQITDAARIGGLVRELRSQRRASQSWLALELGISQGRLSEIERGHGSFSAEQFIRILKLFNVGAEHFDEAQELDASPVQNALSRLGASHLVEARVLVPAGLTQPLDVVLAVLLHPESARHVSALAPVVVTQVDRISFPELAARLAAWGRQSRLGWLLESLTEMIETEPPSTESASRRKVRRAATTIELFVGSGMLQVPEANAPFDLIDPDIRSVATAERILRTASRHAQKWHVATRIDVDNFREAWRSAREFV